MDFRTAIFDLDGTLLDSMPVWDTLGERFLRLHGRTPAPNLREEILSLSMVQTAEYFQAHYDIPGTTESVMAEINDLVFEDYLLRVPAKPFVPEYLAFLRERGTRLCVATATDRGPVEAALKRLHLLELLDGLFTCTEVGAGKDRPDVYRVAMNALGGSLPDTMVFEDALHAIRTAKGAGFRVTAVYDKSMKAHWAVIRVLADRCLFSYSSLLPDGAKKS